MRVCIVAEHASYRFGGEAVLPLHYFSGLRARGVEAWLVVHGRTRSELESAFPADKDRIFFLEDTWLNKFLFRLSKYLHLPRRIAGATIGLMTQLLAASAARKYVLQLVRTEAVSIVHQPGPVSPRAPSAMAKLGVPVVIGPMNGGMEYPEAFRSAESLLTRGGIQAARALSGFVNAIFPGKRQAAILLVANQRTRLALPKGIRSKIVELPENGVDLATWPYAEKNFDAAFDEPFHTVADAARGSALEEAVGEPPARFIFIGRLVGWKRVDIVIEALRLVPDAQLEIVGEGGQRGALEKLANTLDVASRVSFAGWLSQKDCATRLQSAAALVLPSIYECGGAVVLEAMATGTPVIATEWGGPIDYLDESCGYLIPPKSRDAMIQGFARAMIELSRNPQLVRTMGANGRKRVVAKFDWNRKIDQILDIYRDALGEIYEDALAENHSR